MKAKHIVPIFVLVVLLLGACTGSRVGSGVARDTLFSVEKTRNGGYGVFLTHDDSVVYCTGDDTLGQTVTSLLEHHGEVVVTFKSKKNLENTDGTLLGIDKCQNYINGDGTSFVEVILVDIIAVPSR